MAALPAIRVRSDVERKRLFGLEETAATGSGIGAGIYTPEASAATYERLFVLAGKLLEARHNIILDAAFLKKKQRDAARAVATRANLDTVLVYPAAPADVLRARIAKRATLKDEASEADLAVLEHQLETGEEPLAEEDALVIDTSGEVDVEELVTTIRCKLSSTS